MEVVDNKELTQARRNKYKIVIHHLILTKMEKKENMEKKRIFYTVKETKELIFGDTLSLSTLYKLIQIGEIPSVEFNSKKLVPASWINKMRKNEEISN